MDGREDRRFLEKIHRSQDLPWERQSPYWRVSV
jgi:hypothetical protein